MKKIKINGVTIEVTKQQLQEALDELNKPIFKYPICCKNKNTGMIILFESDCKGTVLKSDHDNCWGRGDIQNDWTSHKNTEVWEEIPYDVERGLYHKQPVYCWDDKCTHVATLIFYNAIDLGSTFNFYGEPDPSYVYDNYSATIPEHMKEFKEY